MTSTLSKVIFDHDKPHMLVAATGDCDVQTFNIGPQKAFSEVQTIEKLYLRCDQAHFKEPAKIRIKIAEIFPRLEAIGRLDTEWKPTDFTEFLGKNPPRINDELDLAFFKHGQLYKRYFDGDGTRGASEFEALFQFLEYNAPVIGSVVFNDSPVEVTLDSVKEYALNKMCFRVPAVQDPQEFFTRILGEGILSAHRSPEIAFRLLGRQLNEVLDLIYSMIIEKGSVYFTGSINKEERIMNFVLHRPDEKDLYINLKEQVSEFNCLISFSLSHNNTH